MQKLILILFILSSQLLFAQSFKYKKFNYDWPREKPKAISVDPQFASEDAIILDEKTEYTVDYTFFYPNHPSPHVEKYVRIKFLNENGIKKFSRIILPESFDPSIDKSNVRWEQRDTLFRPKGEFECIEHFAARIIKHDGSIKTTVLDETTQKELIRWNAIDMQLFSWIFRILNLEVNDELELHYAYSGAFNMEPSQRIFFNGDIPKQHLDFTFRYPAVDRIILTYHNGAQPDDSIMVTKGSPQWAEYHFSKTNLIGGINEVGGRPYRQLPYFTYYYHAVWHGDRQIDYGITNQSSNFMEKILPLPWYVAMLDHVRYRMEKPELMWKALDKTNVEMNKFLAEEKQKAGDTTAAGIMSGIQHTVSRDFSFEKSVDYWPSDTTRLASRDNANYGAGPLEKLGKNVANKTLTEFSRLRFYNELFFRLDQNYFFIPLLDKRNSTLDVNRYEAFNNERYMYAVPSGNNIVYFYPKGYRFGYEANELPFYYENISTILIPQLEATSKKYQEIPDVRMPFMKTPNSAWKENARSTNMMINVSLDSATVNCNLKINLSGQFSTLTRGYYMYGERDSTIDTAYYNTIIPMTPENRRKLTIGEVNRNYPYDVSLSAYFIGNDRLHKQSNGSYEIDLSSWFTNLTEEQFTAERRHLDYYPDFQYQDIHRFFFKFDKPVTIENLDALQKNISNSFAHYTFKVTPQGPDGIIVESSCIVSAESIPVSKAGEVEETYKLLRENHGKKLVVKVL